MTKNIKGRIEAAMRRIIMDARKQNIGKSKAAEKASYRKKCAAAKANGESFPAFSGIFSDGSMNTYIQHCHTFINWCVLQHPDVKNWGECRKYALPYLQYCAKNVTAQTLHTYQYALAAGFRTTPAEMEMSHIARHTADYSRSRVLSESNIPFATLDKYKDDRDFIIGTGARRGGLAHLRKTDICVKNGEVFVFLFEKGGKGRWAPVLPQCAKTVQRMMNDSPGYHCGKQGYQTGYVFPQNHYDVHFGVHRYRAQYCALWYEELMRRGYASGELYKCRAYRYGEVYDKELLRLVSQYTGHNRPSIIVESYSYLQK